MAYRRKLNKNKNYLNCYSFKRLLIMVYIMILTFESYSSSLEMELNNTRRSNSITCTKCTIKAQRQWSLEQQKCLKKTIFSNLTASTIGECPQFSVDKHFDYNNYSLFFGYIDLKYIVKMLVFESYCSTLETESNNTSCSNALTCTKCTINTQCQWSLEQQKCIKKPHFSNLTASTIGKCPQFSVDKRYNYDSYDDFTYFNYTFKVSNDLVGFKNYLRTNFWKISYDLSNQPFTEFFYIEFNKVILRFDNVADHYVTFYRRNQCADHEKDKFCAICAWNYNGYTNYLKWCSKDNVCEGRKQLYLKNNAEKLLKTNGQLNLNNRIEEAYVRNDCPEVNVIAVHPVSGPRSGGTVVTITVRNHRIFAEDTTILVMVAGMECMNPRTSGPETITCTTSLWVNVNEEPPTPGPILVKYSSNKGGLTIESSQIFRYDVHPTCGSPRPVLDANQRLRALESGDITVPVRGVRFVKPCVVSSARLFVVLPNGNIQFASSDCDKPVNDTYMVCRSPRVDSYVWRDEADEGLLLNFGLNLMNFIGNQSLLVYGPSHGFHVLFVPATTESPNILVTNGDRLSDTVPNRFSPPVFTDRCRRMIWWFTCLLLVFALGFYIIIKKKYGF